MSLFIFMFILLLFVCVIMLVSLRWVLDHLLGFVWEVPLGGNSPIPPRHLGIFTILAFNLCHPFYFPSKSPFPLNLCHPFYFLSNPPPLLIYVIPLISCTIPLPLYFIARAHTHTHTMPRHLDKKNIFYFILLKWFLNLK